MSLFSRKESNTLGNLLLPGERVITYAKQRKLHGAVFYPTVAIATNRRIIIINRAGLRAWSDIRFINYEQISGLRVIHGPLFSTIMVNLKGQPEGGKSYGEIRGLTHFGALIVSNAINRALNTHDEIVEDVVAEHDYNNYAQEKLFAELGWKPEDNSSNSASAGRGTNYPDEGQQQADSDLSEPEEINIVNTSGERIKQVARKQMETNVPVGIASPKTPEMPPVESKPVEQLQEPKESQQRLEEAVPDDSTYSMSGQNASTESRPVIIPENMRIFKAREEKNNQNQDENQDGQLS